MTLLKAFAHHTIQIGSHCQQKDLRTMNVTQKMHGELIKFTEESANMRVNRMVKHSLE